MIYAKTGMERMPERCNGCPMRTYDGYALSCCFITGNPIVLQNGRERMEDCPLTEIETEDEKHAGNE